MPLTEREQAAHNEYYDGKFNQAMNSEPPEFMEKSITNESKLARHYFDRGVTAALAVAAEQRAEDRKVMEQVRDLLTHVNEVGVHPFAERGIMLALAAIRARLEARDAIIFYTLNAECWIMER